jgi:ABC-type antimicrobial peptide transport system, permease component
MRANDLLRLSFQSILAHRLRSSLTALGILIGIAAVVLLTSIGEGIHRFVLAEFTQFGTHLIAVVPGKAATFGISGATISNVRPLSLADAEALERLASIMAAVPVVQGNVQVELDHKARRAMVFGVGPQMPEVWKMKVRVGRFLPREDYRVARPFAVLGAKVRDELFGRQNPLGQRIRVGGDRYRVIGVMEPKGRMLGFDLDDTVYIPTGKAMELFNRQSLMEIDLLYKAGAVIDQVTADIKQLLIARHGHEDFTLITQQQMLDTLDSVLNVLTLAVGALGGISLLVGGVGILTIMTIAVSERVSEIGLLRAIGAERSHIVRFFLSEAMVLGGLGGAAGVVVGIVLVQLLETLVPALPVKLAWSYLALAFALSLLIGLLAGVIPAMRAANLEPLEALRAE